MAVEGSGPTWLCDPHSAEDGAVEAAELPARPRPAPCQSRLPGGGPQSADDGVVEAAELPALRPADPAQRQATGKGK